MGCQCLGPRRSSQQVYIKLIKQIHQQYSKPIPTQQKNEDTYSMLVQKLSKKGQLRKLTDNLSSRRHKIQEALTFNYKLTSQNKQIIHYFLGLLIANAMTEVIYPKKPMLTAESFQKSDQSSNTSFQKKSSLSRSSELEYKKIVKQNKSPQEAYGVVDEQFLKLIKLIYSTNYHLLNVKALQSVNSFCERHAGVISCETELWNFIGKLLQNIKNNKEVQESCLTFKNLLMRTRDQVNQHLRNKEIIQTLLLLWLNQQQSLDPSTVKQNCYQILFIYFSRFTSAFQSQFLFECIFSVLDAIQFDNVKEGLIQKLCEDLVQNSEFKGNFKRLFFNYLLGYLSVSEEPGSNRRELMSSLGIKLQNIKFIYKNALKEKVKIAGLKRMNTLTDKKYIDFTQFCTYNNKSLIYVYTSVLLPYLTDQQACQKVLLQYKKTLSKISLPSKQSMVETAIEELQEQDTSVREQRAIQILIKELIEDNLRLQKTKTGKFIASLWFIPIQTKFSISKKMEIIYFNTYLLSIFDLAKINQETIEKIAEIMYSFYQNIVNEGSDFQDQYFILIKHLHFLKEMSVKVGNQITLAYHSIICDKSNSNTKKFNIQTQFSLLVLGFTLKKLLTGSQMPQRLAKLKKSIDEKENKAQCLSQINQYYFSADKLQKSDIKLSAKSPQLEQTQKIFNRVFSTGTVHRIESADRREAITRGNSLNSETNSDKNGENDRSFEDALDILNMR